MKALIAIFKGPTWGPSGAARTQVGLMLAPWTLLSGRMPQCPVSTEPADNITLAMNPDSRVHGANMEPIWADRTQVGPMLAPWTLLSGKHYLIPRWPLKIYDAIWYHHTLRFIPLFHNDVEYEYKFTILFKISRMLMFNSNTTMNKTFLLAKGFQGKM